MQIAAAVDRRSIEARAVDEVVVGNKYRTAAGKTL